MAGWRVYLLLDGRIHGWMDGLIGGGMKDERTDGWKSMMSEPILGHLMYTCTNPG